MDISFAKDEYTIDEEIVEVLPVFSGSIFEFVKIVFVLYGNLLHPVEYSRNSGWPIICKYK